MLKWIYRSREIC